MGTVLGHDRDVPARRARRIPAAFSRSARASRCANACGWCRTTTSTPRIRSAGSARSTVTTTDGRTLTVARRRAPWRPRKHALARRGRGQGRAPRRMERRGHARRNAWHCAARFCARTCEDGGHSACAADNAVPAWRPHDHGPPTVFVGAHGERFRCARGNLGRRSHQGRARPRNRARRSCARHRSASRWTALEYGAGTGLLGFMLRDRFADLTLADISEGMLEVATRKVAAARDPHVRAVKLDLMTEMPPDRYDVIFSAMTLHHIPDTEGDPALLSCHAEAAGIPVHRRSRHRGRLVPRRRLRRPPRIRPRPTRAKGARGRVHGRALRNRLRNEKAVADGSRTFPIFLMIARHGLNGPRGSSARRIPILRRRRRQRALPQVRSEGAAQDRAECRTRRGRPTRCLRCSPPPHPMTRWRVK